MAEFGPAPDERELARNPPRWVAWTAYIVTLGLPASSVLMILTDDTGRLRESLSIFYVFGGVTALQLVLLPLLLRWRIMVTDSRVLIRRGVMRRETEEIERGDIESASHEAFMLRIRAAGRAIQVPCHPFFGARVLAAIGSDTGAPAASPGASGGPLASGEQVRLRARSSWKMSVAPMVLALLPLASIYRNLLEKEDGLEIVDFLVLGGTPAGVALMGIAVALAMERSQKKWIVTGRRILNIQGVFRRRVEDIPLDWIEKTEFDGVTLTVAGNGRRLEFALSNVRGEELNRVLGRWFPWRGQPVASAASLLHGGETLLLQRPRKWLTGLGVAAPLLFLAGLTGFLGWYMPDDRFDSGFLYAMLPALVGILVLVPVTFKAFAWTLLVTDRRILLRRGHDHRIYDELPLGDITEIAEGDADIPRVTLRGPDRDYIIAAGSAKAAASIREVIEQARGDARWRA